MQSQQIGRERLNVAVSAAALAAGHIQNSFGGLTGDTWQGQMGASPSLGWPSALTPVGIAYIFLKILIQGSGAGIWFPLVG